MSSFLNAYIVVGLVALVPIALAVVTLTLGRFIRPANPTPEKLTTYESGSEPVAGNWSQTHVRYYLYALLFVVFDVEAVFIIPWAVQVEGLGMFGFVEMVAFVAILPSGWPMPGGKEFSIGTRKPIQSPEAAQMAVQPRPRLFGLGIPVGPGLLRS